MVQALKLQVKESGFKGLYKGFSPCLLRSIPINAGTFLAFEFAMSAVGGK